MLDDLDFGVRFSPDGIFDDLDDELKSEREIDRYRQLLANAPLATVVEQNLRQLQNNSRQQIGFIAAYLERSTLEPYIAACFETLRAEPLAVTGRDLQAIRQMLQQHLFVDEKLIGIPDPNDILAAAAVPDDQLEARSSRYRTRLDRSIEGACIYRVATVVAKDGFLFDRLCSKQLAAALRREEASGRGNADKLDDRGIALLLRRAMKLYLPDDDKLRNLIARQALLAGELAGSAFPLAIPDYIKVEMAAAEHRRDPFFRPLVALWQDYYPGYVVGVSDPA